MRRLNVRRIAVILAVITVLALNTGFALDLARVQMPEPAVMYDIHGRAIKTLYGHNRVQVPLSDISDWTEKAFIAAEDKNFYGHHGIDFTGLLRAVYLNVRSGRVVAGGSTITQQTAKNLFLTQERTWGRKFRELFYTIVLETRYSKNEILQMYLNSIYFGEGATGIEAASRAYFDKSAKDLTLAESALIAGIPRRPAYYDPYNHPEHAKQRQKVILGLMVKAGVITEEASKAAGAVKLVYKKGRNVEGDAPYFTDQILRDLAKRYGDARVYGGGLKIYTTLDLKAQRGAQAAYEQVMSGKDPQLEAALVAVDPASGEVRAMIGGRNFAVSPFNRAVESFRQPGSSFKPFMYSEALASNYTEASMIVCEPVWFSAPGAPDYVPTDYGKVPYHYRAFTLKEAIMVSDNIVAVRLNDQLGPANVAQYAKRFGFSKPIRPVLSLALGTSEVSPLEMASAYSVFASGGRHVAPMMVRRVLDRNGDVLEESKPESFVAISPENAYLITDMLEAVLQPGGTASHLKNYFPRIAAGKTGTTQDFRDAWFVGYTPTLSCAVWVGYDQQIKSVGIPGGQVAGPIWARFMQAALADSIETDFAQPPSVIKAQVCLDTGALATEGCPRPKEMAFLSGTEPQAFDTLHQPETNWWDFGAGQNQPATGDTLQGQLFGAEYHAWIDQLRRKFDLFH